MSKHEKISNHISSLSEISNIVNAMKNLSLMEISKITKYLSYQQKVVDSLALAANDFFNFHPQLLSTLHSKEIPTYIIIGSERGFCGNFNELVINKFKELDHSNTTSNANYIIVGQKLASKFSSSINQPKIITGANDAEEIHTVIYNLINEIGTSINWNIIYNEQVNDIISTKSYQPFAFFHKNLSQEFAFPPLLNLTPNEFLAEFINYFLFAALYQIFYKSFMIENDQRLKHMQGALEWLDKSKNKLNILMNELRQEEITEEIENIMLSAQAILASE
jgi:F-type H+-transporting ATPase subunit gamma